MGVRSLGYIRLNSPNIEAWRRFGEDFAGFMSVSGADQDSLYFRMDHYPPRFVVSPADEASCTAVGFEVMDRRELDEVTEKVRAEGIDVAEGSADECAERRVTGFVFFDDPGGNRIELFYGPILDHVPVQTPLVSEFVTGPLGLGHAIVTSSDVPKSFDFYNRVLGFTERNTAGPTYFLGCNPRHHSYGVAPKPGDGKLVHLMVEAATLDDVGLALDRAYAMELPMMHTLGKHTNDQMVSFYVYSPDNYAFEFGWDGLLVSEPVPTYNITEGAFWGHQFTPPPA